jgi:hypothetical protein
MYLCKIKIRLLLILMLPFSLDRPLCLALVAAICSLWKYYAVYIPLLASLR